MNVDNIVFLIYFVAVMQNTSGRQLDFGIRNTQIIVQWRKSYMVKVRLQGTKQDINWFIERVLKNNNEVKVLDISETYANKGTNRFVRLYSEVEKAK